MTTTKSKLWFTGLLLVAVTLATRGRAEISAAEAQAHLKRGALVVDVRTVEEFKAKSLAGVTNIPLDEIKSKLPTAVTNKSQVILLHCRTGRRSGIAQTELRAMGYTNAFNLGSFEKAQKIVSGKE